MANRFSRWRAERKGMTVDDFVDRRGIRWRKAKKVLRKIAGAVAVLIPNASLAIEAGKEVVDTVEDAVEERRDG